MESQGIARKWQIVPGPEVVLSRGQGNGKLIVSQNYEHAT